MAFRRPFSTDGIKERGTDPPTTASSKQSGGHGQFAVVMMDFAPAERGTDLTFDDAVVGGSVPRSFIPSVEKGLRKAMARGIIAGYPV
ncbi:MAG: hypothetical protein AAFZ18_20420, partial [Myxococcota bacterium]